MATDVASLVLEVDATKVDQASDSLKGFEQAAQSAEKSSTLLTSKLESRLGTLVGEILRTTEGFTEVGSVTDQVLKLVSDNVARVEGDFISMGEEGVQSFTKFGEVLQDQVAKSVEQVAAGVTDLGHHGDAAAKKLIQGLGPELQAVVSETTAAMQTLADTADQTADSSSSLLTSKLESELGALVSEVLRTTEGFTDFGAVTDQVLKLVSDNVAKVEGDFIRMGEEGVQSFTKFGEVLQDQVAKSVERVAAGVSAFGYQGDEATKKLIQGLGPDLQAVIRETTSGLQTLADTTDYYAQKSEAVRVANEKAATRAPEKSFDDQLSQIQAFMPQLQTVVDQYVTEIEEVTERLTGRSAEEIEKFTASLKETYEQQLALMTTHEDGVHFGSWAGSAKDADSAVKELAHRLAHARDEATEFGSRAMESMTGTEQATQAVVAATNETGTAADLANEKYVDLLATLHTQGGKGAGQNFAQYFEAAAAAAKEAETATQDYTDAYAQLVAAMHSQDAPEIGKAASTWVESLIFGSEEAKDGVEEVNEELADASTLGDAASLTFGRLFGSFTAASLAADLLAKAVSMAITYVKESTAAFMQAQVEVGVLGQQFERLGMSASVGLESVLQMGREFGDMPEFRQAYASLLQFDNISQDVFPRLIKVAKDVATQNKVTGAGVGDLSSVLRTLGRAVQDPVNGLGRIREVLPQLDILTTQQVRRFIELGNSAGALELILTKLEQGYGGSDAAANKGLSGALKRYNEQSLIAKEVTGGFFATILQNLGILEKYTEYLERQNALRGAFGEETALKAQREQLQAQMAELTNIVGAEEARAVFQARIYEINRQLADLASQQAESEQKKLQTSAQREAQQKLELSNELEYWREKTLMTSEDAQVMQVIAEWRAKGLEIGEKDLENYKAIIRETMELRNQQQNMFNDRRTVVQLDTANEVMRQKLSGNFAAAKQKELDLELLMLQTRRDNNEITQDQYETERDLLITRQQLTEDLQQKEQIRGNDVMQLQLQITEAQAKGEYEVARGLELQLRLLQEITDEYASLNPIEAARRKTLIEQAHEQEAANAKNAEGQRRVGQVVQEVTGAMSSAWSDFLEDGQVDWKEWTDSLIKDLVRLMFQLMVIEPLVRGLMGNPATGQTGILAPLFPTFGNAKGNVFDQGQIMPMAMGGIVDQPTVFPMRNGMGLMGEAGPEAIMPLKRGADGRLGVEGGGGGSNVTVNIINRSNSEVTTNERKSENGGMEIDVMIDNIVAANAGRPGSATNRMLRQMGAKLPGVRG